MSILKAVVKTALNAAKVAGRAVWDNRQHLMAAAKGFIDSWLQRQVPA